MTPVSGYTAPRIYRYVITTKCGWEYKDSGPLPVGTVVPCGHTGDHTTSTVTTCTPERHL